MTTATDSSEEGGEGYFASISDLMVGILFVFLLMLTILALNFRDDQEIERKKYEQLQEEATRAKQMADAQRLRNEELRGLLNRAVERMKTELETRQAARTRLLSDLERNLREDGLTVIIDPESGILRLPEQLLFDKNQSALGFVSGLGLVPTKLAEAQGNLAKLAHALGRVLPCFSQSSSANGCSLQDRSTLEGVLIEGHADRQGYRINGRAASDEESTDRNDRLSVERALNVFKELRQRDHLDELRNASGYPLLAVSSYGERRPIPGSGNTPEDFRLNRRIDLRFLLSSRTSDDLQRLIDEIRPALGGQP